MTASKSYTTLIHVHESVTDQGRWQATSPDVPGLFVLAPSLPELRERVPDAIIALYLHTYQLKVRLVPVVSESVFRSGSFDPLPSVQSWAAERAAV